MDDILTLRAQPFDAKLHRVAGFQIDLRVLTHTNTRGGIAKLLAADCEASEKAGLCCHFGGVSGPEAERIAAGVAV